MDMLSVHIIKLTLPILFALMFHECYMVTVVFNYMFNPIMLVYLFNTYISLVCKKIQ